MRRYPLKNEDQPAGSHVGVQEVFASRGAVVSQTGQTISMAKFNTSGTARLIAIK
jgi:hypothetical protein